MNIKKPQNETNIFVVYPYTYYFVHISFVIFNVTNFYVIVNFLLDYLLIYIFLETKTTVLPDRCF